MKRVWKNVICGGAMTVLAAGAVFTGLDIFGHQEPVWMEESRDWSFGGYDEDPGFFFEEERGDFGSRGRDSFSFDEDREDFQFGEEDSRSGSMQDQDSSSFDTERESRSKSNSDTESDTSGSSDDSKEASQTMAMSYTCTDTAASSQRRGGWNAGQPGRRSVNGYGLTVFVLELAAIALLAAWMIVSKGNALGWKQVMDGRRALPALPVTEPGVQEKDEAVEAEAITVVEPAEKEAVVETAGETTAEADQSEKAASESGTERAEEETAPPEEADKEPEAKEDKPTE